MKQNYRAMDDFDYEAAVKNSGGNRYQMIIFAAAQHRAENSKKKLVTQKDPISKQLLDRSAGKVLPIK